MTIIPRGRALGLTMQLPLEDKYTYRKTFVEGQIAVLMGGRVAEELTQDDITTGAGNDIERATDMARRMVCEWGMSDLGPLSLGSKDEPVFLGRDFAQRTDFSEDTAIRIDREIERFVNEAYQKATVILTERRDVLERLARDLLEYESLDGREVYQIIQEMTGEELAPAEPAAAPRPPPPKSRPNPSRTAPQRSPPPGRHPVTSKWHRRSVAPTDGRQRQMPTAALQPVRQSPSLRLSGGRTLPLVGRPLVMGVLDITPDSFSDGGLFAESEPPWHTACG